MTETDRDTDETQHQVKISHGFWLSKYEVTQSQWEGVMGSNPSSIVGALNPVEHVSWDDAEFFIGTLNASKANVGGPYRLPTESEWEYAYRAGTTTRFYWGDDPPIETVIDDNAWYAHNSSSSTQSVGEKLPNAWGLFDMSGNVDEWCQDWYGPYPAGPVTDPQGPSVGTDRVRRGGSWNEDPVDCRAATRATLPPDFQSDEVGFRLLRTAE